MNTSMWVTGLPSLCRSRSLSWLKYCPKGDFLWLKAFAFGAVLGEAAQSSLGCPSGLWELVGRGFCCQQHPGDAP